MGRFCPTWGDSALIFQKKVNNFNFNLKITISGNNNNKSPFKTGATENKFEFLDGNGYVAVDLRGEDTNTRHTDVVSKTKAFIQTINTSKTSKITCWNRVWSSLLAVWRQFEAVCDGDD